MIREGPTIRSSRGTEHLIDGSCFTFVADYKDEAVIRAGLNRLTRQTYGFDFESWYQDGYWGNSYIPYSLLDGDTLAANVSVSDLEFDYGGEKRRYDQIGTVMTDPVYRNRGLCRFLIERVLDKWEGQSDLIYLFANDRVRDFYPKFAFRCAIEYRFSKPVGRMKQPGQAKHLDLSLDKNRQFVYEKVQRSESGGMTGIGLSIRNYASRYCPEHECQVDRE